MKYWPSQFLPLLLLALVAALSFWLRQGAEGDERKEARVLQHEADAIGENVVARRFDEHGRLQYRLTAPHLVHFPDDDSSELRSPVLTSYRSDAPPITISGDHAKVTAKGEIVYLWDNVRAVRPAGDDRPQLVAVMPDLIAHPEEGFAFTQSPVEITQGASWVKGVGLHLDNNTATLVLQSQVRGEYIRPRATP